MLPQKKGSSWERRSSIRNYNKYMIHVPLIVLGNWNVEVGREEPFQGIIGRQRIHLNTNNNVQRLVDFATTKHGVILSLFPAQRNSYTKMVISRWKNQ